MTADRQLLRLVTRRHVLRQVATITVVALAAIGGFGTLVGWGTNALHAISSKTRTVDVNDTSAADAQSRVVDFAQTWVIAYLAARKGNEADLAAFYSGEIQLPDSPVDAINPAVSAIASQPGPAANLQLWSVVIGVDQRESADSFHRRRVYYQAAISVIDNARPRALTEPAVVPPPRKGVDVALDYETAVSVADPNDPNTKSDPAVDTIKGFLRALLAGGPDMGRYVAAGYKPQAWAPPLYQSLTVTGVRSQAPTSTADGRQEVRMLATVTVNRAFATASVKYPLRLVVSDGRWEVSGIEMFPAVSSKASEPPATAVTPAPNGHSNDTSFFGKP